MTRIFILLLACACAAMPPARMDAQSGTSLEATMGFGAGGGGGYGQRDGMVLDLLLARRVRETSAGTLVAAITAGVHGSLASDLVCLLGPDGECLPDFPVFFSAGVLAGVQRGPASSANARLLAGPAIFMAQEGGGTLGLQGRLDAATPALLHVSLVASLQGAVLPRFQGETLTSRSLSLGLRIQ